MAANHCPLCGSKYVVYKKTEDSFEKTTEVYYCQSCKRNFNVEHQKQSSHGKWILSVYDGYSGGSYKKELHLYQSESGYMIDQKDDGKCMSSGTSRTWVCAPPWQVAM